MLPLPLTLRSSRRLAVVLVLGLTATAARADLRFAQPKADVGEVRCGAPLTQRFTFTNTGPEAVEIIDLRASCGCLKPRLDQRSYQRGEEGALILEVNTLSQPPGPNTWRVQVMYKSGDVVQEVALQLSARINVEITVQPAAMNIHTDNAVSHEVVIMDRRPKPLTITAVQASSPKLKAQVTEQFKDVLARWVRKVRVDVAEDYPEGRHEEVLSIYTDDPGYRELRVPVTVVKRPRQRLSATPSAVTLQAPPGQPVPSRIVLLRDVEDQKVMVEGVTVDDPALTCSFAQGPEAMATVKISADRTHIKSGSLTSAVHVKISQPIPQTLTIPVSCTVP